MAAAAAAAELITIVVAYLPVHNIGRMERAAFLPVETRKEWFLAFNLFPIHYASAAAAEAGKLEPGKHVAVRHAFTLFLFAFLALSAC
jgi:hypothetical protein